MGVPLRNIVAGQRMRGRTACGVMANMQTHCQFA
jgi:hypothetical protein